MESKLNTSLNSRKIDEPFSTCRTPLEVLRDCQNEPDWLENLSDAQKLTLKVKADRLKEISPSCDCIRLDHPDPLENGPFYVHLGHAE